MYYIEVHGLVFVRVRQICVRAKIAVSRPRVVMPLVDIHPRSGFVCERLFCVSCRNIRFTLVLYLYSVYLGVLSNSPPSSSAPAPQTLALSLESHPQVAARSVRSPAKTPGRKALLQVRVLIVIF